MSIHFGKFFYGNTLNLKTQKNLETIARQYDDPASTLSILEEKGLNFRFDNPDETDQLAIQTSLLILKLSGQPTEGIQDSFIHVTLVDKEDKPLAAEASRLIGYKDSSSRVPALQQCLEDMGVLRFLRDTFPNFRCDFEEKGH